MKHIYLMISPNTNFFRQFVFELNLDRDFSKIFTVAPTVYYTGSYVV